jgi:DNA-binding transcriptional regulator PaaX
MLLFDLPERQQGLRSTLWRWMKRQRFGYLQQSAWVTPDVISENSIPLRHLKPTPESLMVVEGTPAPPDTSAGIVRNAWDFTEINRNYTAVMDLAIAGRDLVDRGEPRHMRQWLADERAAWLQAIKSDPLLPEPLLPENYLGRKAWHERRNTFLLYVPDSMSR